jgi:hypothetical protein
MRPHLVVALVVVGCGKSPSQDSSKQAAPTTAPAPAPEAPTPVAKAVPVPQICSSIAAADVGAMYGKKAAMIATGSGGSCEYQLDPAEKEKQMQQATAGGMAGLAKTASKGGIAMPTAISEQLDVKVLAEQKDESEDSVKAIYNSVSATTNGATAALPKPAGAGSDMLAMAGDIAGVGDWAFATNVASVNLGGMMSMRGRLLEAKKGAWRITVSVNIAPDPGTQKLDDETATLAKAVIAKLP